MVADHTNAAPTAQRDTLRIPDVSGLSTFEAALKYAECGLYVLPVKTGKHPGSAVGKDWPKQSSKDPDLIEYFWDLNPDAGIAIHTGKSGLVAFDLDIDVIPAELSWLKDGLFQHTRSHGGRGHYVFASDEVFASTSLTLKSGAKVGEVRSGNTVIIAQPSPHAKADDGGQYLWATSGVVPELPQIARQYLRVLGTTKAGGWSDTFEASDELVKVALKNWTDNARPQVLDPLVNKVAHMSAATRNTTRDNLRIAACEARVGFYPLQTAVEKLRAAMRESYKKRSEDNYSDQEFGRLVANGVGYALSRSFHEILTEADRDYAAEDLAQRCEAFWNSSDQLRDLRQFARARLVGPWSMLGATLARVVSAIPPHVVLPPTVGSHASLNLFIALVGKSGESKSASMLASADWLTVEPDIEPSKPGSGEGLAKCFAFKEKMPNGGGWVQRGKHWSVLAQIPEVDTLTATGARGGATIMSTLREGWSGERLGQDYAGDDKRIVLAQHRYRLCLVVGVQPLRAEPLFKDADGGTPQRFVWFSAVDDDMPDSEPPEPPKLNLGRWEPRPKTFPLNIDDQRKGFLHEKADPADYEVLKIPEVASAEIKSTQRAIRAGKVEPLDGHRLLVQLKVAGALMAFEGRRREITESDWDRAATVMKMSDRTRRNVINELKSRQSEQNASRAKFEGERADIAEQARASRAVERIANKIVDYLTDAGGELARAIVRKRFNSRDRGDNFDDAEVFLIESDRITKHKSGNDGPDGFVLRLVVP